MEYYDSEFGEYATLANLEELPQPPKIRLVIATKSILSFGHFANHNGWKTIGHQSTQYCSFLLKDGTSITNQVEWTTMLNLLLTMGFSGDGIAKAFAIDNRILQTAFDLYHRTLAAKWRASPHLFKKDDWKKDEEEWRSWSLAQLTEYFQRFEWNEVNDNVN